MRKLLALLLLSTVFVGYAFSQQTITGKVLGAETQEPLPGVTVLVQGTTRGTVTDLDGNYKISASPTDVLVFGFIGYLDETVTVGSNTVIDITLIKDLIGLGEVVVIGYGTARKGDVTGAISSVSSDEIQELPVIDAGSALQGRASGVMALSAGSNPGDGVTIRVRGRRSLRTSNDPLYVVDGIPYEGNINDINPRDIKSMEILKDASATAIYGFRGANGVILITTVRGGDMATTVSYNTYYGVTSAIGKPDMMNSQQFMTLKEIGGYPINQAEIDALAQGVSTDWIDLSIANGSKQSHQLAVRGGNEKTAFAVSTNLFKEKGVIEIKDYTRKTLRINLDHKVSKKIKIGTSTQLSDMLQNVGSNVYGSAINASPLAEPYDTDGNIIYQPGADPLRWNPLADLVDGAIVDERTRLRVFSNLFAEVDIYKDLKYRMNYGTDYQKYRRGLFEGSLSSHRQYSSPRALKEHQSHYITTFENILTYTKDINENHSLKATGLFSLQNSTFEKTIIDVEDLSNEQILFHRIQEGETVNAYDSYLTEWGIMSFMGRIHYELMDKYLFTFTTRADGSTRLSEGHKWNYFPSAAFLWKISNEGFMQNQSLFTDLRLRLSRGVAGSTTIPPYRTKSKLARTVYSFGEDSGYGFLPYEVSNPDLRWATTASTNIGIDFGLGQNIVGTFQVYQTNTTNLLLQRYLPPSSGFDYVWENIGETMNQGWELSFNTRLVDTREFRWSTDLNLFGNREEIVSLYLDGTDDIGNQWFIGEPLTVWYDYEKLGIWQTDEADQAALYGAEPGFIKVRDVPGENGQIDSTINANDKVILGSNIPTMTVGLGSKLSYRNFEFSFLVFGSFGQMIFNEYEVNLSTLQGRYNNLNVDYWTEDNPTNDHPKPDGSREYPLYGGSRGYQNGDFLKIKNVQLAYNLPKDLLSKFGIKSMKVYINSDTPFIFSGLANNLDPEVYDGRIRGNTPSTRMYSLGINVDF